MFRPLWYKRLWLAWLIPLTLISCTKPTPRGQPIVKPIKENRDGSLQFLVEDGESSQAVYSSDGDRILFVSRKRPSHIRNQVYEKDLRSGVEKRLTFQNGNAYQPHYQNKDGFIIYASSTDELEENPELLRSGAATPSKLPFPYQEQMEIYVQALRGFDIIRQTQHPGFDGEARFSNDDSSITFTRAAEQKTHIMSLQRKSKAVHELRDLGVNPTQYNVSPDGKTRAWIEWDESFGVTHLRVARGAEKPIELASDQIVIKTDVSFAPDSKRLFWAAKDPLKPAYDLWTADLEKLCVQRLTQSTDIEYRDPVMSPDQRWLTFTYKNARGSRIARQGFKLPSGPCPGGT
jgi:Tol biopolymer transport system component